MTDIIVTFDKYVEEVGDYNPNDEWDRPDTDTSWHFSNIALEGTREKHWNDESYTPEVDFKRGDECYVVIAVWSSGDSFGRDSGYGAEIFGAYKTLAEATARKKELEAVDSNGKDYRYPWVGYFEYLDYVTIESTIL